MTKTEALEKLKEIQARHREAHQRSPCGRYAWGPNSSEPLRKEVTRDRACAIIDALKAGASRIEVCDVMGVTTNVLTATVGQEKIRQYIEGAR